MNLLINSTKSTPLVSLEYERGSLLLAGKSLPEESISFYSKIEAGLQEYINKYFNKPLVITCEFEYVNSSSSKLVFSLLKKAVQNLIDVKIIWSYEEDDDDMKELGEDFQDILYKKFEFRIFV